MRLQVPSYDVTALLREGTNVIGQILGDGWWLGLLGAFSHQCTYGAKTQLAAQQTTELADSRRLTLITDEIWKASQDGPTGSAWHWVGDKFRLTLDAPTETEARLPDGSQQIVASGEQTFVCHLP